MGYSVFRVTYSPKGHPKHNIISVIFNDTVQDNISRGLAESMIMAEIRARSVQKGSFSRVTRALGGKRDAYTTNLSPLNRSFFITLCGKIAK